MFGLSSLYRRGVVRFLVAAFYLYGGDSDGKGVSTMIFRPTTQWAGPAWSAL